MKNSRMKKIIAALLALLMTAVCLTACSGGKPDSTEAETAKVTEAPAEATAADETSADREEVSRVPYYDCDGSDHGYYEITYSDGSTEYVDF